MATQQEYQKILAELRKRRDERPELAPIIEPHYELLAARAKIGAPPVHLTISGGQAEESLREGIPLLRRVGFELDPERFPPLFGEICQIAAHHRPELASEFAQIKTVLVEEPSQLRALMATYLQENRVKSPDLNPELLAFVLNNALHPFLKAYAEALRPLVKEDLWRRGRCPVCDGEPDFAYLTRESGGRGLLCSRCDTQWLYKRLECPFCGNTKRESLAYYPSEDNRYRLYVCDECKRYLKAIDLREVVEIPLLPVERIVTIDMDLAARENGYR